MTQDIFGSQELVILSRELDDYLLLGILIGHGSYQRAISIFPYERIVNTRHSGQLTLFRPSHRSHVTAINRFTPMHQPHIPNFGGKATPLCKRFGTPSPTLEM